MKRPREKMRRLLLQQLERRCVMDASGFDEVMEATQDMDFEATSMMFESNVVAKADSTEMPADDAIVVEESVDDPRVMYFSMAGGLDDGAVTEGVEANEVAEFRNFDFSELERTVSEDGSFDTDLTIQTLGANSSESGEMFETTSIEDLGADFWLDIDQNGLVSAVDAWMIINLINTSDSLAASAEFDVNGDSVVSPLDVLIVINELNSAQADANGFTAPAVSSSRLATRINPESIVAGDFTDSSSLPIDDESSADSSARMIDSAMADFADDTDDDSEVGSILSMATYTKKVPQEDESIVDSSSDDSKDSKLDGSVIEEPILLA